MIRDDDLTWARDLLERPIGNSAWGILARLVLHTHEQDTAIADMAGVERDVLSDRVMALEAENARLRAALRKISEWDMLNPPQTHVVSDLGWLRRLVDDALTTAGKDTKEALSPETDTDTVSTP